MSRTTIRLRPDLMERAKEYAREHHLSFTDVVELAIERHLNILEAGADSREPVKLTTFTGSGGIVDGLTYEEALERANLEADMEKLGLKHVPH